MCLDVVLCIFFVCELVWCFEFACLFGGLVVIWVWLIWWVFICFCYGWCLFLVWMLFCVERLLGLFYLCLQGFVDWLFMVFADWFAWCACWWIVLQGSCLVCLRGLVLTLGCWFLWFGLLLVFCCYLLGWIHDCVWFLILRFCCRFWVLCWLLLIAYLAVL